MKKAVLLVVAMTVVAGYVVLAEEQKAAAEEKAPATAEVAKAPAIASALEVKKTGYINVIKDAAGAATGVKLIVQSYDISMDDVAKELVAMDGQKVKVTGSFAEKDGKKWFAVKSFEAVKALGAPAAAVAPAAEKPAEKAAEKAADKPAEKAADAAAPAAEKAAETK